MATIDRMRIILDEINILRTESAPEGYEKEWDILLQTKRQALHRLYEAAGYQNGNDDATLRKLSTTQTRIEQSKRNGMRKAVVAHTLINLRTLQGQRNAQLLLQQAWLELKQRP